MGGSVAGVAPAALHESTSMNQSPAAEDTSRKRLRKLSQSGSTPNKKSARLVPVELQIMNGHPVIVTKFDRWAEQLRGVVKGIEVRGHNEVNHWNEGLGIWSTLRWNADMTNMYTLVEPHTALRVLQTELERHTDLASSVTIKDPEGNTRTLEELENYDFGHLRTPPYRSHRKHVEILNILY